MEACRKSGQRVSEWYAEQGLPAEGLSQAPALGLRRYRQPVERGDLPAAPGVPPGVAGPGHPPSAVHGEKAAPGQVLGVGAVGLDKIGSGLLLRVKIPDSVFQSRPGRLVPRLVKAQPEALWQNRVPPLPVVEAENQVVKGNAPVRKAGPHGSRPSRRQRARAGRRVVMFRTPRDRNHFSSQASLTVQTDRPTPARPRVSASRRVTRPW